MLETVICLRLGGTKNIELSNFRCSDVFTVYNCGKFTPRIIKSRGSRIHCEFAINALYKLPMFCTLRHFARTGRGSEVLKI